jgi:hypothetical protein
MRRLITERCAPVPEYRLSHKKSYANYFEAWIGRYARIHGCHRAQKWVYNEFYELAIVATDASIS